MAAGLLLMFMFLKSKVVEHLDSMLSGADHSSGFSHHLLVNIEDSIL